MKYFKIIVFCFVYCSALFGQENNTIYFEPEKIVEDIDFLLASLNNIHPAFNQTLSDHSFKAEIDSIKNTIHQPLSKYELFKIMQPLISVDAHTSLQYDGRIGPEMESPFFPFKIIIMNNQIHIKENLSSDQSIKKGMIIESVNGMPASILMDQLSKYIPHDGSRVRPQKMAGEFHVFYRLVYGNFSEFSLVLNDHGKKNEIRVPGIKLENFGSVIKPQFDFKVLENSTSYLTIGKFSKPNLFLTYIDSIFTVLQENHTEYLIIDKRSGGGFSSLADSLLSYLTDKPYSTFGKKTVKISSANEDYVNENKTHGTIQDGFLTLEYSSIIPNKHPNRFRGKTYILMDYETSSAATYFASAVKCNKIAFLVGEEAAQPLISNGDIHGFNLPNTQLKCYSSMSTYYYPCAENRDDSVKPDYEVRLNIEDLFSDKDEVLEYVLELIDNDNKN